MVPTSDDKERTRARIVLIREHIEACPEDTGLRIKARKEQSRGFRCERRRQRQRGDAENL
jgi:hypothetical protein